MTKRHLVRLTPSNSFNNDQVLNPDGQTVIDVVLANPTGAHQAYLAPGQEIGEEVFIRHILRPRQGYENPDSDDNAGLWTIEALLDSFHMQDVSNLDNPTAPFQWDSGKGQNRITFEPLVGLGAGFTPPAQYHKPVPAVLILRWTGVYWAVVFASSSIQRPT